ncbi:MAG: TPM domain-containing protein [Ruminococcus sp.]|nr:TPM domain-containing protein [Ruminococcus sp.]
MKKFSAAVILAAAMIALSGCSGRVSHITGMDAPAETTMAPIEAVTAAPLPDISGLDPAEGTYVYDSAGVLTAEQRVELDSYCEKLYRERLVNAAVVIADDIGGKTPYEFADERYTEIYEGRGSGLLLLINNDTGSDYLYRTGSCLKAIPDGADSIAFFWATRDIMDGDYRSAILRVMQLGERCPLYVFDNIGLFSDEELDTLETTLAENKKSVYVLATSNGTDKSNEDICRSYFERRSEDGKGCMIMLDTKSNTVTVVSDGSLGSAVDKAKTSAEKLLKSGDAPAAVNEIVAAIG